ncbi:MAG: hypothetical protein LPK19_04205, partial [Hymenobacteraceae bacterium]|nr:hypothetical protein [Hymenobacteraceae bacterium]MDX5395398.1 hypothetical protein [Hymenobacteraceae bacterium]MDX5511447.1 hypothetical protein [Hymenobacteraceae bacterium]
MIENLINQIKGELTGELQNKTQLDANQASRAVDIAKENISGVLKDEVKGGNISGLMNLMKGGQDTMSSPIVNNITQKFASDLLTKLHLPKQVAEQAANFAIPFIINKLTKKTGGENMSQSE